MPLKAMTDGGQNSSKKKKTVVYPSSKAPTLTRPVGGSPVSGTPKYSTNVVVKPNPSAPTLTRPVGISPVSSYTAPKPAVAKPYSVSKAVTDVGTGGLATYPTMKVGSTGEDVRRLQHMLGVAADGVFGKNTLAAVQAYQNTHGLDVDGIVGKNTWNALSNGLSSKAKTPAPYTPTSAPKPVSSGGGTVSRPVTSTPSTTIPSTPAPSVSAPSVSGDSGVPEFSFNEPMPEFKFNYQGKPVQSMEELIALAAQQLDPQYQIMKNDAAKKQKENLQNIDNDMIRKGRFASTYAGNVKQGSESDYSDLLADMDLQKMSQASEIGRANHQDALDRADKDYDKAYQEAMDAYNRAMGIYDTKYSAATDAYNRKADENETSYQRGLDAQNLALERQQLANSQRVYSGGSGGSSGSSKTNPGDWTAGDKTYYNNTRAAGDDLLANFKAGRIDRVTAVHDLYTDLAAVRQGAYSSGLKQQLEDYLQSLISAIGNSMTPYEQSSREQRKNAR